MPNRQHDVRAAGQVLAGLSSSNHLCARVAKGRLSRAVPATIGLGANTYKFAGSPAGRRCCRWPSDEIPAIYWVGTRLQAPQCLQLWQPASATRGKQPSWSPSAALVWTTRSSQSAVLRRCHSVVKAITPHRVPAPPPDHAAEGLGGPSEPGKSGARGRLVRPSDVLCQLLAWVAVDGVLSSAARSARWAAVWVNRCAVGGHRGCGLPAPPDDAAPGPADGPQRARARRG
jgi:hypothetical protein